TGAETTFVLDPGWTCTVWDGGTLDCRHTAGVAPAPRLPEAPDPVGLELFSRRFMGVAERMGETLRRVAWSTNIRERLDFSCAVFDAEGHLLANAPHIPVHLGAMGETVRALRAGLDDGALRPGRSWAVNDPQMGGSHLPDITVVTPVYDGPRVFAWVASRGHHADVGGITPGSMPPFSTSLAEEGVLLRALLLVDGQEWQREQIAAALAAGPYPVRDPATVQADLQAQVAANQVGVHALQELRARCGAESLSRWMGWVLDNGEAVLQDWLESLPDGPLTCADAMDDGTAVVVGLTPLGTAGERRLRVDFTGTGPASSGNLNAPKAVVRAALLYVLRCAMGREIPLNDGVLRGVDLEIPANSLLAPPAGAAVVGGNVETSQRVVDVLLGALGLAAASQGTMNNLCFGTSSTAYYETIAGGAGGTATAPGASCVQTHMTNTRITDPEVLERRFPVLVEEFSRRRGSGGTGRRSGGDGVQRVLRFLEPVQVSLLSQRRSLAPGGLRGGGPGLPGEAARIRGGLSESLPGCFAEEFEAGDVLVVGTPGGGAYGAVDAEDL
ncbi:MAG: hydantoinase B/oxoprolinase family protein, partial [Deltaproteobacteria bacterium]|nr:hydantoinase B/oxoprolinase family protein [Deltaproteobacteria bacterium]